LKQGFELIGATAVHYCSIGRNNQFSLLTTIKPELGRRSIDHNSVGATFCGTYSAHAVWRYLAALSDFLILKKTDPGSNEVIV